MPPTYNVYLSKLNTTPDNWDSANEADYDHANGWVMFICSSIGDKVSIRNTLKHLAGHISYRLPIGKLVQSVSLEDCTIVNTGGSEDSDYYNEVKEFLVRHALTGANAGYDLYLRIYDPSFAQKYIRYVDNTETWRDYCQVAVTGFAFKLDNTGVYTGSISLEEVWD